MKDTGVDLKTIHRWFLLALVCMLLMVAGQLSRIHLEEGGWFTSGFCIFMWLVFVGSSLVVLYATARDLERFRNLRDHVYQHMEIVQELADIRKQIQMGILTEEQGEQAQEAVMVKSRKFIEHLDSDEKRKG